VKNRMLEIGTSGTVRGEDGNILTYSAWGKPAIRNERGDDGNGGIIRSPQRAIVLPDREPAVTAATKRTQQLRGVCNGATK
jgi:hypothetical protein